MLRIKKYHFDCHNSFYVPIPTTINGDHAIYQDTGKKQEWTCVVYAEPSIFQPETDMEMTASASNEIAKQSQKKSLKPGDRLVLTGIMREDTLLFPTGKHHCVRAASGSLNQQRIGERPDNMAVLSKKRCYLLKNVGDLLFFVCITNQNALFWEIVSNSLVGILEW